MPKQMVTIDATMRIASVKSCKSHDRKPRFKGARPESASWARERLVYLPTRPHAPSDTHLDGFPQVHEVALGLALRKTVWSVVRTGCLYDFVPGQTLAKVRFEGSRNGIDSAHLREDVEVSILDQALEILRWDGVAVSFGLGGLLREASGWGIEVGRSNRTGGHRAMDLRDQGPSGGQNRRKQDLLGPCVECPTELTAATNPSPFTIAGARSALESTSADVLILDQHT
jgi:hypothetical protein